MTTKNTTVKETTFTKVTQYAFLALIIVGSIWNSEFLLNLIPHHVIGQ